MGRGIFRRRNRDRSNSDGNNNSNRSAPSSGSGSNHDGSAVPIARAVLIDGAHANRTNRRNANGSNSNTNNPQADNGTINSNNNMICYTCRQPIARNTRHIHTSRTVSGERRYHRSCFVCLHCNAPIDPQNQSFCYAKLPNSSAATNANAANNHYSNNSDNRDAPERGGNNIVNNEQPFHRECFAHHFGWICVVCEKPLPMVTKVNSNSTPSTSSGTTNDPNNNPNSNAQQQQQGGGTNSNNNNTAAANAAIQNNNGSIPGKSTKVEFLKHPFFDKERMCPHHAGSLSERIQRTRQYNQQQNLDENLLLANNTNTASATSAANNNNTTNTNANNNEPDVMRGSINTITTTTEEVLGEIRRCAGCHRFEPLFASPTKHFIDVGDSNTGRCVCLACCRTVVTNSEDVIPLWDKVIDFFEGPLGLITSEDSTTQYSYETANNNRRIRTGVTRRDLKNIPIMVTGMEALNENQNSRGSTSSHFGSSQIMTRGLCLSEHNGRGGCDGIGVTAILCLSGLPADLTASILAHEATHAWIKLHPNFPYTTPLPLKVEEGICQLVAFLFLNDGLDPIDNTNSSSHSSSVEEDESIPSDEKLRQYFRFCIETDEGVYGEGFRLAARAYAKMGMQELLYHVAMHHDFPPLYGES